MRNHPATLDFAFSHLWIARFALLICLHSGLRSVAQTTTPPATKAVEPSIGQGAYNYLYQAGLTCGTGASTSRTGTVPTVLCGGLFTITPFFEIEAGVIGPQSTASLVSGYISTNAWVPLQTLKDSPDKSGLLFAAGGYTRMFETGHALDYGIGYAHPLDPTHSIRFEARDYWVFSNPRQHNVVFRIVWLVGLPD